METLQDLGKEYERRFAALAPYREEVWQILVRDFFQAYVPPRGLVLDLGSGWGEFIRNVKAERRFAMDLNPEMPGRVGPGVETILQDCAQPWPLADDSLDVVFTSNFFEHLPDKTALRRTLQHAARCLRPGGRIICLGPNIRFLPGAYWDFWDHFLPLTDRSLVEILSLCGFAVERAVPRFLPLLDVAGIHSPGAAGRGLPPPAFPLANLWKAVSGRGPPARPLGHAELDRHDGRPAGVFTVGQGSQPGGDRPGFASGAAEREAGAAAASESRAEAAGPPEVGEQEVDFRAEAAGRSL